MTRDAHDPSAIKLVKRLTAENYGIFYRCAWSPDGRRLAVPSSGYVRVWDVDDDARPMFITAWVNNYNVAWSPDGRLLAFTGDYHAINVWDTTADELAFSLRYPDALISGLVWSPDGQTLAAGYSDGTILLWDLRIKRPKKLEKPVDEDSSSVFSLAWSPDGKMLASGSLTGTVRVWVTEKNIFSYLFSERRREGYVSPSDVAWSRDGGKLADTSTDGTIRLLDARTKQLVSTLEGHERGVLRVSFSSDGRLLASRSGDGTIRLWRCDTWETVSTIAVGRIVHTYSGGLDFHPKLPLLAAVGENDRVVNVWSLDIEKLLSATPAESSVHYTTAKIALVGDSGVGKTGLGWRLAHGEFKEHPSTHGQQFWVVDEFGATREDGTKCEAVLWDLAGQPDYRLIHALFLNDIDLALVLFDPTDRQEPLKGVEYWLKHLARGRRDGRKTRLILVGARSDRGVTTLTREEVEEFCKRQGFDGGYVGTSAATGEGLAELLARVKSSIAWDEMPATVTTETFKRIKEFVLALKEDGGRGAGLLVGPEELRARLEAEDAAWEFTDAEMMTAVRHLANHGYVSVLRGSSGEETVLLAPDLLVNLASSFVLEARRNPRGLGALEEARVLAGGYEFPELVGLVKRDRDVLLDAATALFLEHNLCFRETLGAETFLIFPALINQKRPQLEEVETEDDVSYRVTGAVENVYASLVVQLGYTRNFTRTNQWQNQAEYETARGDVCGFRQVDEREGETELVLYYAKGREGARLLFQGLFEEFLRGRDVSVTKFPPVRCPACEYRQQRGEVVNRIGEGKGFLFCSECGEKIALPKQGERVKLGRAERGQLSQEHERTRRRTAFESALVRVKAVVRDEKKSAPSCFISYAWGDPEQERWVRGLAKNLENAGIEVIFDQKDSPHVGANVARFVGRIEQSDFVAAVATPLYRRKYENKVSTTGSVVAAEVDLINLRLTGTEDEKAAVLPLLLEGEERDSLPPLMRGKARADFRREALYFATLFDLILTLYGIPFMHPALSDLRDSLRAGVADS